MNCLIIVCTLKSLYRKCFSLIQAYVYDGKTAEKVGELGSPSAHNGGIYAVSAILIPYVNNIIWRSQIEIS